MGLGKLFDSKPANGQKVAPDDRVAVAASTSPTPAPAPATGKEGMLQSELFEGRTPYLLGLQGTHVGKLATDLFIKFWYLIYNVLA